MWKFRRQLRSYSAFMPGLVMLLLCGAGVILGIIPAIGTIKSSWEQLQTLSPEVAALRKRYAFLQSLDESTMTTQLQQLGSAVPGEPAIGSAFIGIESVARDTAAGVTGMSLTGPGDVATDSAIKKADPGTVTGSLPLPIKLSIQGDLSQIRSFLTNIVGVRRLYRTNELSIEFGNPNVEPLASSDPSLPTTPTYVKGNVLLDVFYAPLRANIRQEDVLTPLTSEEENLLRVVSSLPWASQASQLGEAPTLTGVKPNPFAR